MILRRLYLCLFLACLSVATLTAEETEGVDAGRVVADIARLADPAFSGRYPGTDGNRRAGAWLAGELEEAGYRPLPGAEGFELSYSQTAVHDLSTPVLRVLAGSGRGAAWSDFRPGVDFDVVVRSGAGLSGSYIGPVTRLPGIEVDRSWVRERRGTAVVVAATDLEGPGSDPDILAQLFDPVSGPAVIFIELPPRVTALPRSLYLPDGTSAGSGPLLVQVTRAVGAALSAEGTSTVELVVEREIRRVECASIAGRLAAPNPHRSPALRPLLVTAHFDGPGSPVVDDQSFAGALYPGAVDNGSGVAVVLEIARVLADEVPAEGGPSRPVWVVFFNGEEQGLQGSRAFVSRYGDLVDEADVVNVDMVGHCGAPVFTVTYGDGSGRLGTVTAEYLRDQGLDAATARGAGSDHGAFESIARALSVVQAPYRYMHTTEDTFERVCPERLEAVARGLLALLRDLRSGVALE